jgi:hypothetical protein
MVGRQRSVSSCIVHVMVSGVARRTAQYWDLSEVNMLPQQLNTAATKQQLHVRDTTYAWLLHVTVSWQRSISSCTVHVMVSGVARRTAQVEHSGIHLLPQQPNTAASQQQLPVRGTSHAWYLHGRQAALCQQLYSTCHVVRGCNQHSTVLGSVRNQCAASAAKHCSITATAACQRYITCMVTACCGLQPAAGQPSVSSCTIHVMLFRVAGSTAQYRDQSLI